MFKNEQKQNFVENDPIIHALAYGSYFPVFNTDKFDRHNLDLQLFAYTCVLDHELADRIKQLELINFDSLEHFKEFIQVYNDPSVDRKILKIYYLPKRSYVDFSKDANSVTEMAQAVIQDKTYTRPSISNDLVNFYKKLGDAITNKLSDNKDFEIIFISHSAGCETQFEGCLNMGIDFSKMKLFLFQPWTTSITGEIYEKSLEELKFKKEHGEIVTAVVVVLGMPFVGVIILKRKES